MIFKINNIGPITKAEIEIDGITIVAGNNNVGKSTIGKTVYSMLHDMNNWPAYYRSACQTKIKNILYKKCVELEDWCLKYTGAKRRRTSKADELIRVSSNSERLRIAIEDYQIANHENNSDSSKAKQKVVDVLYELFDKYLLLYSDTRDLKYYAGRTEWAEKTADSFLEENLDEVNLQSNHIEIQFNDVFKRQFEKIKTSESSVVFSDNNREVLFKKNEDNWTVNQPIRSEQNVYFIESPKIFDLMPRYLPQISQKEALRTLMRPNIFIGRNNLVHNVLFDDKKNKGTTYIDENLSEDTINISDIINQTLNGNIEFSQKLGFVFKDNYVSEGILAENVSLGVKSMAVLEYAFRVGAISKGDILILDEPEVNLHPEWQVIYAEILVELQRKYKIKILLTTHSPYFIRAIECYSDKEKQMDKLNVYYVERSEDGEVNVDNVSYSEYGISTLYEKLSAPLEKLDEIVSEIN